ncbi:MAG: hypothetical protein AAGA29_00935 [Planctomycetota bacterium]
MPLRLVFTLSLIVSLFVFPVSAEELIEESGSTSRERRVERFFEVGPDTELTLTLSCESNAARQGLYRIYFYKRSPSGRWSQINELRLQFTTNQAEVSDSFRLPAGDYRVVITTRYMDYLFRLEDDQEPDDDEGDGGSGDD